jgi:hypothetical protein
MTLTEHVPAEHSHRPVRVAVFTKHNREHHEESNYDDAIEIAAVHLDRGTVSCVKIKSRDGEIVFNSNEHDLDRWEREFRMAKRRMEHGDTEYICPHDISQCEPDNLCVRCRIEKLEQ